MKVVSTLFVAMAVATAGLTGTAPAAAQGQSDQSKELHDYCYGLMASGDFPNLNLGECMSFNVTSDSGFKTKFCDFLLETDTLGDYGFNSFSDCVRNVN